MKNIFLSVLLLVGALYADNANESLQDNESSVLLEKIAENELKIKELDELSKLNVWLNGHNNYNIYKLRNSELNAVLSELKQLRQKRDNLSLSKINDLEIKEDFLKRQLEYYADFKDSPFADLLKTPDVPTPPSVTNPVALIGGFSYITQLKQDFAAHDAQIKELENLLEILREKSVLIEQIMQINGSATYEAENEKTKKLLQEFESAHDVVFTSALTYEQKINDAIKKTTGEIKKETKHSLFILIAVIFTIIVSFLLKLLSKRLLKEKGYIANKIINIANITIIIFILLFAYIQNVAYLAAILGVASAGIAIAMKDLFMNVLGWIVITFGGSFSVGDRVKVQKDGMTYVGDIIDISLMRLTVLEDVTLTTYLENRRAGRVVFIPNNFIFTTLISNYTHETLKTVWDGIYITISFDSNYKKAMYIIKEVTKKCSRGYTELARTQLNHLRQRYNLRNTNVEPKIFSFIEPHGLTIHVWYMTNSYAALALRSTLSGEIIDAINKEDDIMIAYPTQTLNLKKAPRIEHLVGENQQL